MQDAKESRFTDESSRSLTQEPAPVEPWMEPRSILVAHEMIHADHQREETELEDEPSEGHGHRNMGYESPEPSVVISEYETENPWKPYLDHKPYVWARDLTARIEAWMEDIHKDQVLELNYPANVAMSDHDIDISNLEHLNITEMDDSISVRVDKLYASMLAEEGLELDLSDIDDLFEDMI
ncbi:hypothetical protein B0T22DRAFT_537122 [Podospora appendiculata]|uniref:Uncharacterized protein n=1 Tax=Podospora appendiculata TaxID=314037 RepID=A0AAE1CE61_9PEZI|nr:hypothetical protein B0T22DRAFT_537122 [Podospora appendiculata]